MKGKVAYMTAPMNLEFREYEVPEPGPGAIVARVLRTNVCGSELHIWRGHHPLLKQGILGHEMLGQVYRMGAGITTAFDGQPLKEGDRIVCTYFQCCQRCRACRRGQFNLCENCYSHWVQPPDRSPHFHGTFATHYYIHPTQWVYKVPDDVSDAAAASANCALSQVLYGLDLAGLQAGETVVLQGAGGLGLNAVAVAKERGARVIIIDGVRSRLQVAARFGADHLIDLAEYDTTAKRAKAVLDITDGFGADVGMELTGVPAAFAEGVHIVRPGGRYVSIGNISPGQVTDFDPGLLTRRGVQIYGVIRYQPWYLLKALQFLSRNRDRFPFEQLLDAEFTLESLQDALEKSARREVTRATVVTVGKA